MENTLTWEGPFTFRQFISQEYKDKYHENKDKKRGVYLWIEPTTRNGKEYRTSYVGKASGSPSLWTRQFQHFKFFRGGLYTIPEEHFDRGEWRAIPEEHIFKALFDPFRFHDIVNQSFEYMEKLKIYLAPVGEEVSNTELKMIERNLTYTLQPIDKYTPGKKTPPNEEQILQIVHTGADWWQENGLSAYLEDRTIDETPSGVEIKLR